MRSRWRGAAARIALGAVAVAILASVVLWIMPEVLTHGRSTGLTAAEQLKASNDVRTPLVAFLVAVGAAGTLAFTYRTYLLNKEGQVTDRYTKAVGQLGDEKASVRIGAVYALGRIGRDSPDDRASIVHVLGAFVREQSELQRKRQDRAPDDIQAAVHVAGRLLAVSEAVLDLREADLRNTDLTGLKPQDRVLLDGAKLDGARHPAGSSAPPT